MVVVVVVTKLIVLVLVVVIVVSRSGRKRSGSGSDIYMYISASPLRGDARSPSTSEEPGLPTRRLRGVIFSESSKHVVSSSL